MPAVKRCTGNALSTRLLFETAWSNRPVAYNTPFNTLRSERGTFGSFEIVFIRRDRALVLCTYHILRYNERPIEYVPIIPLHGLLLRGLHEISFLFFFQIVFHPWKSLRRSFEPLRHLTVTRRSILQIISKST